MIPIPVLMSTAKLLTFFSEGRVLVKDLGRPLVAQCLVGPNCAVESGVGVSFRRSLSQNSGGIQIQICLPHHVTKTPVFGTPRAPDYADLGSPPAFLSSRLVS